MSELYLAPAAGETALEHLDATVYEPVPLSKLSGLSEEALAPAKATGYSAFPIWGTRPGQAGNMVSTWQSMEPGDWVLFYTGGAFPICGSVIATDHSPSLAETLWGTEEGETWEYLYLLDEIRHIGAPKELVFDAIHYSPNFILRGFLRVDRDIEDMYGSVDEFLDDLSTNGHQFQEPIDAATAADESKLVEAIDAIDDETSEEALIAAVRSHTSSAPEESESIVKRVKRNWELAAILKELYDGRCQICGFTFTTTAGKPYSEAAHLTPISKREPNLDVKDNLVILCANHHKMLDRGGLEITYESSELTAQIDGKPTSIENKHIGLQTPVTVG